MIAWLPYWAYHGNYSVTARMLKFGPLVIILGWATREIEHEEILGNKRTA